MPGRAASCGPDHSVNEFFTNAAQFKTRLDAARSHAVKAGDDDEGEE